MNECVPAPRGAVVRVATPLARAGAPSSAPPSQNWTWPVGLVPVTVVESVTTLPSVGAGGLNEGGEVDEPRLAIVTEPVAVAGW